MTYQDFKLLFLVKKEKEEVTTLDVLCTQALQSPLKGMFSK